MFKMTIIKTKEIIKDQRHSRQKITKKETTTQITVERIVLSFPGHQILLQGLASDKERIQVLPI